LLLKPLVSALPDYVPEDPPPEESARHATVHHPGRIRYSAGNAIIAVMLVVSILREAEEFWLVTYIPVVANRRCASGRAGAHCRDG
jgi:hypothetical protein